MMKQIHGAVLACLMISAGLMITFTPGCAKDGIVASVNGNYRTVFKDRQGRWYYVERGEKKYLPGPPPEVTENQTSEYTPTGAELTGQEKELLDNY